MNEQIKKEGELSLKWLYLAWFSIIFCTLIIGIIGAIVQGDPEPVIQQMGIGIDVFALCLDVIGMIIAVVILRFLLKKRGLDWEDIGLKGKLSLHAIGFALVCVLIALLSYRLIEISLGSMGMSIYWNGKGTNTLLISPLAVVLVLISEVLVAPVTEEIIHRGYVLAMFLERKHKPFVAVLLSALIYSSITIVLGPGMMVYIFLWSFIPAFLYLKFKSLYPGILFHFLNNLIVYIIIPIIPLLGGG
ncbi:MAG TPA: CPBP family intramembrane metalloprotease [Thermoplasmata archaeon]|nr:CPBP family intramembrane metalloprotease [Thermoplasmata archaeon]